MRTRALRQKSSSTGWAGASAQDCASPRARSALRASREWRLISSLSVIVASPSTDHPAGVTTPGVGDFEIVVANPTQGTKALLTVIAAFVLRREDDALENELRILEVYTAVFKVNEAFALNPMRRSSLTIHNCGHNRKP
jgi:hypothetical protein